MQAAAPRAVLLVQEEGLNVVDFPLGRWAPQTAGTRVVHSRIEELFVEYDLAGKSSRRHYDGHLLRSRMEMITLVIRTLESQGGYFKKKNEVGTWCIINSQKEARTKVSSLFSEYKKRHHPNYALPDKKKEQREEIQQQTQKNADNSRRTAAPTSVITAVRASALSTYFLTDDDFPTGRQSRLLNHPKIRLMKRLVEMHAAEYNEAAQQTEERQFQGRRMRSKSKILTLVVNQVKPWGGNKGYYKKLESGGVRWEVNAEFNEQKLRTKVSNLFNKRRDNRLKHSAALSRKATEALEDQHKNQSETREEDLRVEMKSSATSKMGDLSFIRLEEATQQATCKEYQGKDCKIIVQREAIKKGNTEENQTKYNDSMKVGKAMNEASSDANQKGQNDPIEAVKTTGKVTPLAVKPTPAANESLPSLLANSSTVTNQLQPGGGDTSRKRFRETFEREGRDEWFRLCQQFDEGQEKYGTQTAFLKHSDSGPKLASGNSHEANKHRKAMSRYYKLYKTGDLRPTGRRRNHFPVLEDELNKEFDSIQADAKSLPSVDSVQQMALVRAHILDMRPKFKASKCWVNGFVRNWRAQQITNEPAIVRLERPTESGTSINDLSISMASSELDDLSSLLKATSLACSVASSCSKPGKIRRVNDNIFNTEDTNLSVHIRDDFTLAISSSDATFFDQKLLTIAGGVDSKEPSIFSSISYKLTVHQQRDQMSAARPDNQCLEERGNRTCIPHVAKQEDVDAFGRNSFVMTTPTNMELCVGSVTSLTTGIHGFSERADESVKMTLSDIKNAMSSENIGMVIRCLERLSNILINEDDPPSKVSSTTDDVVTAVTRIIQSQSDREDILKLSFGVLCSLSDLRVQSIPSETIQSVIVAMYEHARSPLLQAAGCNTLSILSWYSTTNQTAIAAANGIATVVVAMQNHSDQLDVQECGCLALGRLARHDLLNQTKIASSGGMSLVVRAMQHNPEHLQIQENGCFAIANLAFDHLANQTALTSADSISVIMTAMRNHSAHSQVQARCCFALGHLANSNTSNQTSIAAAGSILAVVAALQHHFRDLKVQEYGCYALGKLVDKHMANQKEAASAGGLAAVIAAMLGNQKDAKVQRNGSKSLCSLVFEHPSNQSALCVIGGIKAIIAAMENHPDDLEILQNCCNAIEHLASSNSSNKAAVAGAGGVEAVRKVVHRHSKTATRDKRVLLGKGSAIFETKGSKILAALP